MEADLPFYPVASDFDAPKRAARLSALPLETDLTEMLVDYWLQIAGTRLMPEKSDLDPAQIKPLLPHLTLHEFEGPDMIRLRLMGTALYSIYRRDLTGRNYLDFVTAGGRRTTAARLHVLMTQPCGLKTMLVSPTGDKLNTSYETLGLPLADRDGKPRYVIYAHAPLQFGVREEPVRQQFLNAQLPDYIDIGAGLPPVPEPV